MSQKKTRLNSVKKLLLTLVEILFLLIFIYAALQLYSIFMDYKRASDEYAQLSEQVISFDVTENEEELKVEDFSDENVDNILDLPYDYKVPSYEIDLEEMKTMNQDTIGWIILPDSKINYPIVKSKDNTEYLTTTFEGKKAKSGAIFMDMYCAEDFSYKNTIIYGHNMKNGSMFRALNNMTDKEYFWRHHIFCIDTGNGFENYEVISCYETVASNLNSWRISFDDHADYEAWLEGIVKRCIYDCVDYDVNKNTITLSTCRGKSNGSGRFIVHLQKKD